MYDLSCPLKEKEVMVVVKEKDISYGVALFFLFFIFWKMTKGLRKTKKP